MANEATVTCGLDINVGKLAFSSFPKSFNADVSAYGNAGPTPGRVLATVNGTQVDLSKIVNPGGLAVIQNLDLTNYVEIGLYDPDSLKFYPFQELLPGEVYPLRLSRNYAHEYTGSGTSGSNVQVIVRVDPSKSFGTTAWVLCLFFDK